MSGKRERLARASSWLSLAALVVSLSASSTSAEVTLRQFDVRLHIVDAIENWGAVEFWSRSQLDTANRLFSGAGVRFQIASIERNTLRHQSEVPAVLRTLVGRSDRDDRAIDIYVIPELDHSGCLAGVALRPGRSGAAPGFVVVRRYLYPTLSHELAHYFGLEHSSDPENLMYSDFELQDDGHSATLDAEQLRLIERNAGEMQP